jgi:hypothetical protein
VRDQVVIHAQLVDQVGLVATRSFQAQLLPANFKRTTRVSRLTMEHDPRRPVGRLAALERDERSGVWGTWVSDEFALLTIPELYISGEMTWEGRGAHTSEITVVGASIVAATASSCTRPATVLVGDLLSERDHARWRNLPQPMRDRLGRAAADLQRRNRRHDDFVDLINTRYHRPERPGAVWRFDRPQIDIRPCTIIGIS